MGETSAPADWRERAACAPQLGRVDMTSDKPEEIDRAKRLCRSCPVRVECAQHALDERELWGVWGGTEDWQRRRALGVDSIGGPRVSIFDLWCPFCQSGEVSITKKRAPRGYPCECDRCGVRWFTYRYPLKVRRALKRRQERRASDGDVGAGLG